MKRLWAVSAVVAVMVLIGAGCDAINFVFGPVLVTVELVNNSDFPVEVRLFYDDEDDIPDFLLTETNERNFNLDPGETEQFTRSCDDLRAIMIDKAELQVIGVSPDADTGVLRDGDDFECGDTIVFTFDHGPLLIDFDIDVDVRPGAFN
jgi:hypothetical protein